MDDAMKKKMATVQSDLLRKFTDIAFDETAQTKYDEFARKEKADRDFPTESRNTPDLFSF